MQFRNFTPFIETTALNITHTNGRGSGQNPLSCSKPETSDRRQRQPKRYNAITNKAQDDVCPRSPKRVDDCLNMEHMTEDIFSSLVEQIHWHTFDSVRFGADFELINQLFTPSECRFSTAAAARAAIVLGVWCFVYIIFSCLDVSIFGSFICSAHTRKRRWEANQRNWFRLSGKKAKLKFRLGKLNAHDISEHSLWCVCCVAVCQTWRESVDSANNRLPFARYIDANAAMPVHGTECDCAANRRVCEFLRSNCQLTEYSKQKCISCVCVLRARIHRDSHQQMQLLLIFHPAWGFTWGFLLPLRFPKVSSQCVCVCVWRKRNFYQLDNFLAFPMIFALLSLDAPFLPFSPR